MVQNRFMKSSSFCVPDLRGSHNSEFFFKKIMVLWYVTWYNVMNRYGHFREISHVMVENEGSRITLNAVVTVYQTTLCYILRRL